ncbi:lipoprotein-releasing ABC transporter permease subunit LolE [Shewanella inventionis]|uniref:Cell division protein FtsX n=1 Tax=Shewanella inventionis TaxID=1738770 RepID=A0ABQ1J6C2_9GAMM|nr:lipoprotein-releasing ABC transporter permease subunit LolE [Shewanella inventionis]MCL1157667.1 lipoprotein-releasing ABC transporter permease subunit LolE [Shewanella inventionis]UAL41486.1 lipoprotein-releasing ABC transporter permease subunit LolE [Shewanella inventionis]GGB59813.1 cell division protein FtsX [Shewanella inventionis]
MSKWLPLTIGWRFFRAKQSNSFIGFISFASTAGIALGVSVLIVLLSTMNGFERELQQRLLGVASHGELVGVNEPIADWHVIANSAQNLPQITGVAPFIRLQGLVQKPGGFQGIVVSGIDINYEADVSSIQQYMPAKAWQSLQGKQNNVVLGRSLLNKLELKVGDTLAMYTPDANNSQLTSAKSHRFVVSGVYDVGGEIESTQAYVPIEYLADILGLGTGVSGVRIEVADVLNAAAVVRDLGFAQEQYLYINDWTRSQGHVYQDIQLVRLVMYLVLALVIGVACFNIVSTLVMAVRDKASEIAILMTMGLGRAAVMTIFILQGALNGIMGCTIGGVLGVVLAYNLSAIAKGIEQLFGFQLLASDIYFIDFLPSELHSQDVIVVLIMGLVMSLLATIYPAWKATKIAPATALAGR